MSVCFFKTLRHFLEVCGRLLQHLSQFVTETLYLTVTLDARILWYTEEC